jgi:DNA-binding HxlR family transcriptional regulator
VDYELTPLGASLQVAVNAVKVWAEIHMDEIEAARSAYDVGPAPEARSGS